jgi:putative two-component system response regulator
LYLLLEEMLDRAGVDELHHDLIVGYLSVLWIRDPETFNHSLRVADLSARIAAECGINTESDLKNLFHASLLHDVGKLLVNPSLLGKTAEWTAEDAKEMDDHPEYGWLLLFGLDDYAASIVVRHHYFGERPYPHARSLPPLPDNLVSHGRTIQALARVIALADTYDALTTRECNQRFGRSAPMGQRERYLQLNPNREVCILDLEKKGVLTFTS